MISGYLWGWTQIFEDPMFFLNALYISFILNSIFPMFNLNWLQTKVINLSTVRWSLRMSRNMGQLRLHSAGAVDWFDNSFVSLICEQKNPSHNNAEMMGLATINALETSLIYACYDKAAPYL
jgi:hypothetical protein